MFPFNIRQIAEKAENLEQQVQTLQSQNSALQTALDSINGVLTRRLGVASPAEVVARLDAMEAQNTQLKSELEQYQPKVAVATGETSENPLEGLNDPRQIIGKMRAFTTRIETLNGTVSSMEEQLMSLYAEKERLEREIGASEVDDVLEAFRDLRLTIHSMETQLMTMYAGREVLDVELGKSDPWEIVAMFRNVSQFTTALQQALGASEYAPTLTPAERSSYEAEIRTQEGALAA